MSFFFQAEDGIRDWSVTGVQTCALPISLFVARPIHAVPEDLVSSKFWLAAASYFVLTFIFAARSEERRVGKECRSRWQTYHSKKKQKTDTREMTTNDHGHTT